MRSTIFDKPLHKIKLGGGGVATQKTERYRKFQIWDWFFRFFFCFFFRFFSVFLGFSILANFDRLNGFLLSDSCWL